MAAGCLAQRAELADDPVVVDVCRRVCVHRYLIESRSRCHRDTFLGAVARGPCLLESLPSTWLRSRTTLRSSLTAPRGFMICRRNACDGVGESMSRQIDQLRGPQVQPHSTRRPAIAAAAVL